MAQISTKVLKARFLISYAIALALMVLVAGGSHLYVISQLGEETRAAEIVNISGRQRMLAHRGLALSIVNSSEQRSEEFISQLAITTNLFSTSHNDLAVYIDDHPMPATIERQVNSLWGEDEFNLTNKVDRFIALGERAIERPLTKDEIIEMEELVFGPLSNGLGQSVNLFQADAEFMLKKLEATHFWQMVFLVVILCLEAIFIFIPILNHLLRTADQEREAREAAEQAFIIQESLKDSKNRFMSMIRQEFIQPVENIYEHLMQASQADYSIRGRLLDEIVDMTRSTIDRVGSMARFYDQWDNEKPQADEHLTAAE